MPSKLGEFIFESLGERAYVDVSKDDTLANVRAYILEDLDTEQLPKGEFAFKVNGIRISAKQESKKTVHALLEMKATVELISKSKSRFVFWIAWTYICFICSPVILTCQRPGNVSKTMVVVVHRSRRLLLDHPSTRTPLGHHLKWSVF